MTTKRRRFSTNLATIPSPRYPPPPYKARGWHLTFGTYLRNPRSGARINNRLRVPKRIVIHAATQETAQNAVDLITAAVCLINENCGDDPDFSRGYAFTSQAKARSDRDVLAEYIPEVRVGDYQFSCLVAVKVSHRRAYQNALYKYKLSQQSFYTFQRFLDPSEWSPQKFVFNSAEHQVRCAQAVILAYSVVEELGFEIRATPQKPSFIDGVWNPVVRTDLEQRLTKGGVNLTETALWTMRDTPTRIERNRAVPVINRAQWAYAKVRDSEIDVVDAVARASWLRSKVSAHRLHALSASLNYYDVANMQYLARRLLLEALGLWRYRGRRRSK
jgi:hypothetical protein